MRMWMVDPKSMCRKHLLGEHGELHKFLHCWEKKFSIKGRIENNSMEPLSYKDRHDELAEEMLRRGYNHNSQLEQPDFSYLQEKEKHFKIDRSESLKELTKRCVKCHELVYMGGKKC